MFTAGGSYARLSRRQGTNLWANMVCKLVPFFMPWKHGYGSLQSTYVRNRQKVLSKKLTEMLLLLFRKRNKMDIEQFRNVMLWRNLRMEYLTTAEIAKKWDLSTRRITILCNEGRIEGAIQKGKIWLIPDYAQKPVDGRRMKKNRLIEG